jgi:hypothetical protein
MDRGRPQGRQNPNPFTVDRRGNAVGLLPSFGVRPMAITTIEEYLREFSVEIGPHPNEFPSPARAGRPSSSNPGNTSAKAICCPSCRDIRCSPETPASRFGCHHHHCRNGHRQDSHGGRSHSRCRIRTPIRLPLHRSRPDTAQDCTRNPTNYPRRQDVCDRQPAVAAPRSNRAARSQRTAVSEWPDCPRWCAHHAHRHEVAGQIQIRHGSAGLPVP